MIHGYSELEGCNLFYTKLAIFVDNLKSLMEISYFVRYDWYDYISLKLWM